jgi:tripartite-type tricarboxylate transporter receptor subunit TctC
MLAAPRLAIGQATPVWPHDRVTIVTSLPAGSSVDITTRVFAERLAVIWGKPVVVDNRGGANGVLACQHVARSKPDGLTLLATSAMTHAANPALLQRLPYDPVADFAAITRFGNSPFVVMAYKGLGTTTLSALIARLRAEPGKHNYGWGAVPANVASALLLSLTGLEVPAVGYRGNQAGFPDLINGRLSFMSIDVVGAKPLVDRGEVHAVALTAPERHFAVPEVPSCVEAGLPELHFTTWSGLYAPRGTPPEIIAQVQRDYATVFDMPEVRARLRQMGSALDRLATPEEFQAFTIAEIASWGRIIRQAGMRLD